MLRESAWVRTIALLNPARRADQSLRLGKMLENEC